MLTYYYRRGISTFTGDCNDGYICAEGSIYPTGLNDQECEQGQYCIAGIKNNCTDGTYNPETAATSFADCIPCEHGQYCTNRISSKVDCPAGVICEESTYSNDDGTFNNSRSTVKMCPKGEYCPTGSYQGLQ